MTRQTPDFFKSSDIFVDRHIGPRSADVETMLSALGFQSLDELVNKTIPRDIRFNERLNLPEAMSEREVVDYMKSVFGQNESYTSYIGMGYADTVTPPVIQRNVLENPGWYTQYTPYQAEIAQGRLEALFNFQTVVCELTGMEISNASMLDEATAGAEAIGVSLRTLRKNKSNTVFVSERCHPQTIAVIQTRCEPLGIEVVVGDHETFDFDQSLAAAVVQYPTTDGAIYDYTPVSEKLHAQNGSLIVGTDLMALTTIRPPSDFGADIVYGTAQRFGVPLGYGGPHPAFMASKDAFKRQLPGRIVGQSIDADGEPALRLALQTREQHIRRDRATSNICTAQVLLAIMASFYAVYHGPDGLRKIGRRIHLITCALAHELERVGFQRSPEPFFDTLRFDAGDRTADVLAAAAATQINLRRYEDSTLGITIDEKTNYETFETLVQVLNANPDAFPSNTTQETCLAEFERTDDVLRHEVFHRYHSETEFLRYVHRLQSRDLSLVTSMIPLGSCTMKLNATTEMLPVTWDSVGGIHPFAPLGQTQGYAVMIQELEQMLAEITGMDATSLQPNAGSQGEYAGMLAIAGYHRANGDTHRNICLIPESAHGTNPASAVMAGLKVKVVKCDERGNINVEDLAEKVEANKENLAAIMVTYPSTHGVFETAIREICDLVHQAGGQVYLDGANMNAQVGLCRPGDYGADVCHLNLHKTFCIPHGGGGPGMGPICVRAHLQPFLPTHPVVPMTDGAHEDETGPVSAAPWGSPSILPISWSYILMLGADGLKRASEIAILNANYMAKRLEDHFPILYRGDEGMSAHEFIIDLRPLKKTADIEVVDIAKRLMDYGFHAPTISFPVAGTMMIEPTESESKEEVDKLCDALIQIRDEITKVENGEWPKEDNPLKNAPHTARVLQTEWTSPYSMQTALFPADWVKENKFWPSVSRIDDAHGDRNLICSCVPISEFE